MNYLKWKLILPLATLFISGCNTHPERHKETCPDIQGSYKIEKYVVFYIQKQSEGDYLAMVQSGEKSTDFLTATVLKKQYLEEEKHSECAVIIECMGLLMPAYKDEKYSVSAGSQNYITEKKRETPLVILFMAGFQSIVFSVDRTSNTLPPSVLTAYVNKGK